MAEQRREIEGKATDKGREFSVTVRSNVAINLVRTLAMTALSFITFPYVTRALGDATFGLYTWANAFVYYFLILAKISIPNIAIRECAKARGDKRKFNRIVQQFFLLQCFTTLISFGLMSILVFSVDSLFSEAEIIFLLSINFLAGVFSFEWVYIALEKHFYITVRSVALLAFAASCTFLFVRRSAYPENYLYVYALIAISSTILTAFFNCLFLGKYVSLRKVDPYDFKPYIGPLVTMALLSLTLTLYNQTDEFILGFIDPSKAEVGSYSVGVKGVDIIITLITSLYAVFMPRAAYYHELPDKIYFRRLLRYSFNITFFIAVPAFATMSSLATPITSLISGGDLNEAFSGADLILMSLSGMMLTYSLSDDIYTEILIPEKKERHYLYALTIGVLLNVSLSFLFAYCLTPSSPGVGVAIATMVADVVVLAYLISVSKAYSIEAIFNYNNLKIVGFGIAIFLLSFFVYPLLEKEALSWGLSQTMAYLTGGLLMLGIDAAIYIFGLLAVKETLVSSLFRRKQRKENEQEPQAK